MGVNPYSWEGFPKAFVLSSQERLESRSSSRGGIERDDIAASEVESAMDS